MPYIKMLTSVGGRVGDHDSPPAGAVLEVDDEAAASWADGVRAALVDAHGNDVDPPSPTGDVPDRAVDAVDWVGDDLDRARAALEVEQARDKPRKTVLGHLDRVLNT